MSTVTAWAPLSDSRVSFDERLTSTLTSILERAIRDPNRAVPDFLTIQPPRPQYPAPPGHLHILTFAPPAVPGLQQFLASSMLWPLVILNVYIRYCVLAVTCPVEALTASATNYSDRPDLLASLWLPTTLETLVYPTENQGQSSEEMK
ncbi:hypothetical protein J6590_011098 [Homalodisca vitripennis]|nr:hypothetical protein J6590_011098 [Homalodisca vitripennis]